MSRSSAESRSLPARSDLPFHLGFGIIGSAYLLLILLLIGVELSFFSAEQFLATLRSREVQYSVRLSLFCCAVTTCLSLLVAIPVSYLMSQQQLPGKKVWEFLLDLPHVLPPLVIGLCLLLWFQTETGRMMEQGFEQVTRKLFGREMNITYEVPSILLAQFVVASSLTIRVLRRSFEQIDPACEQVARTLGCSRSQAFWKIQFPQVQQGILAAGALAWARALGEFGPVLILAGAIRMKTEVLPTTLFLEFSRGHREGAVAASLILVIAALFVLLMARLFGLQRLAI